MPALHDEQIDAPVEPLYLPASQATHALALQLPLLGLALPAAHGTGPDDVDGQYEPAAQIVQFAALPIRYVPFEQLVGDDELDGVDELEEEDELEGEEELVEELVTAPPAHCAAVREGVTWL